MTERPEDEVIEVFDRMWSKEDLGHHAHIIRHTRELLRLVGRIRRVTLSGLCDTDQVRTICDMFDDADRALGRPRRTPSI